MLDVYEDLSLREREDVFVDRGHAGAVLAQRLVMAGVAITRVLAIPAGGVPVAVSIATGLHVPLDVAVTSKITLPWNCESGYGAVSFDGSVLLNDALLRKLPLTPEQVEEGIERTRRKVVRRAQRFRRSSVAPALGGELVLLVDDGLASGVTMRAAARACHAAGAGRVGVAVPTAHVDALRSLEGLVDFVACPNVRSSTPYAVADAYQNWRDVLELEAEDLLTTNAEILPRDNLIGVTKQS
jgi:predicted phosphoribosyltransferase